MLNFALDLCILLLNLQETAYEKVIGIFLSLG